MRLNKKQKFIALFYFSLMLYLLSSVPMVKSWPCGCRFWCEIRIWEKPPLLFDSSVGHVASADWSIDWWVIAVRLFVLTALFLVAFVLARGRRKAETE
jgi:hypothetical protein